jgi:excisionase family DNA binding protein
MIEELYTPEEIASRLKVTRRTVYQWLKDGHLQAMKVGKGWRISPAQLEAFAQRSSKPREAQP